MDGMIMAAIKLGRLPDRTPVKITIAVAPDLNRMLQDYAEAYRNIYGEAVSCAEIIPAILETFLASDRAFARMRKGSAER
jgi:hypothetical protein